MSDQQRRASSAPRRRWRSGGSSPGPATCRRNRGTAVGPSEAWAVMQSERAGGRSRAWKCGLSGRSRPTGGVGSRPAEATRATGVAELGHVADLGGDLGDAVARAYAGDRRESGPRRPGGRRPCVGLGELSCAEVQLVEQAQLQQQRVGGGGRRRSRAGVQDLPTALAAL